MDYFTRDKTQELISNGDAYILRKYFYKIDKSKPTITTQLYDFYVSAGFRILDRMEDERHYHRQLTKELLHWQCGAMIIDTILLIEGGRRTPVKTIKRHKDESTDAC